MASQSPHPDNPAELPVDPDVPSPVDPDVGQPSDAPPRTGDDPDGATALT